jgi:cell wall-associated NlpC family hydrolase
VTERGTARHRAPTRATTPLTTLSTGITQVVGAVGDSVDVIGRSGAVMAVSTGLVASMALPAGAAPLQSTPETVTAPLALGRPSTASGTLATDLRASTAFSSRALQRAVARAATKDAALARARTAAAVQAAVTPAKKAVTPAKKAATATRKAVTPARKTAVTPSDDAATTEPSKGATAPAPGARGSAVLAIAARYVGIYYRPGGTTPAGFDCSGFTQYVYRQVGITLPRTAQSQMNSVTRISRSEAAPGDLVFVVGAGVTGHVGIYAGGNMMYDSPRSGKALSKREIWTSSVVFGRVT